MADISQCSDTLHEQLNTECVEYKSLTEEMDLGWTCDALNHLWEIRQTIQNHTSPIVGNKKDTDDRAFLTPGTGKYYNFFLHTLGEKCPDTFYKRTRASKFVQSVLPTVEENESNKTQNTKEFSVLSKRKDSKATPLTFIDMGSAPGGFSKYMFHLGYNKGYAFSLQPESGGLVMKFSDPNLVFQHSDFSKEGEWKMINEFLNKQNCSPRSVAFINMGIVVDMGQNRIDDDTDVIAEKKFQIQKNQVLVMLSYLKPGGSAMLVQSTSKVNVFFYLLCKLNRLFGNIRVITAVAKLRAPAYVVMETFKADRDAISSVFREIMNNDVYWRDSLRIGSVQEIVDSGLRYEPRTSPNEELVDTQFWKDLVLCWTTRTVFLKKMRLAAETIYKKCDSVEEFIRVVKEMELHNLLSDGSNLLDELVESLGIIVKDNNAKWPNNEKSSIHDVNNSKMKCTSFDSRWYPWNEGDCNHIASQLL